MSILVHHILCARGDTSRFQEEKTLEDGVKAASAM